MMATKSLNFLKLVADPENARLDIVAVHGLNTENKDDHAELTWTASNKKMWLRDFLPKQRPDARVLLFGYNSNVGAGASTAGVDEQAGNLLNRLGGKRKGAGQRPIIFICHSLGGIIVKKALIMARIDETYRLIHESCRGIVFFGTPHRGGNVASLGNIAASIARQNQANTFLEALKKDSLFADNISNEFRHQLEDYRVVTIFETLPPSKIIVDQKSATLGLSGKRERQIAMDADHENICRFEVIDGDDYQQVSDNILELAEDAIKDTSPQCKNYPLNSQMMQDLCLSNPEDDRFDLIQRKGKRLEHTCQWILKDPEFEDWSSPNKGSGILWIYGKPGVGKTMISDFLIETFESKSDFSLAYFFCDEKDIQRNSIDAILRGFLWQILNQIHDLSDHIEHRHVQEGRVIFERTGSLSKIFSQIMRDKRVGDVYWVIDGLDECTENSRRTFLELLASEFTKIAGRVKLVIVSRPLSQISVRLKKFSAMNAICVESRENDDIDEYIDYQCEELVKTQKYQESLASEVKRSLKEGSDKMFLWVSLVVEELRCCAAESIEETLRNLPKGLDGVYEQILSHIPDETLPIALAILSWIAMAARPLTRRELAAARAKFGPGDRTPDELEADLRLCERFITSKGEKIHLIHQSVKEYLLKPTISSRLSSGKPDAEKIHSELAEVCLLFLTQEAKEEYPPNTKNSGFPQYSFSYWPYHLRLCGGYPASGSLRIALDDFLSENSSPPHFEKWLRCNWSYHEDQIDDSCKATVLYFASYVGICSLIQHVLTSLSWNKLGLLWSTIRDRPKWTPLHLAALNGHSDAVKLLLSCGFTVHAKTHKAEMTALHLAARGGHFEVLKILLDRGARINAHDRHYHTALYWAAVYKHGECTAFLVKHGADKNQQIMGETHGRKETLIWAIKMGKEILVKQLLDSGANMDPSILYLAVENRKKGVIQVLLENGAEANSRGGGGDWETVLHVAIRSRDEAVVKLLLENGAEVKSRNRDGETALYAAVRSGDEAVVKLLLENGAEVNSRSGDRETVLYTAVRSGDEVVVKLLLENGVEVNSRNMDGETALYVAVRLRDEAVVKLLLENGAEVNSRGGGGDWETVLHAAIRSRDRAVVKLLLENGAEVNSRSGDGETVLYTAVCSENEAVVKLLLENGAEVNPRGGGGDWETVLHVAVRSKGRAVVKLLLENGIEVNSRNMDGETALYAAVRSGDEAVVKLLLENGAEVNSRNMDGETALYVAVRLRDKAVVKLLQENGAEINSRYRSEFWWETELNAGVRSKDEVVVSQLEIFG